MGASFHYYYYYYADQYESGAEILQMLEKQDGIEY